MPGYYLRRISKELTYAAIDIGSNAVRLLVGDVIERTDHPVVKKSQLVRVPIRLGEDVFANGRISNAKADYLIRSLKAFRLLTEVYGIDRLRCCATSALREATNREEVVARAEVECGVHIEVISGNTEADLICATFWTQDLVKDSAYLYIDVGGGSTELSLLEGGKRIRSASFRIGTVRSLQHKVEASEWAGVAEFLGDLRARHGKLMAIGTGGNINRIFKENGNQYGEPLTRKAIQRQRDRIAAYPLEERTSILRLRPDRADVIVPAADIFLQVLDLSGINAVHVPKVGLADGMVYGMYMEHRGHKRYPAQGPADL